MRGLNRSATNFDLSAVLGDDLFSDPESVLQPFGRVVPSLASDNPEETPVLNFEVGNMLQELDPVLIGLGAGFQSL